MQRVEYALVNSQFSATQLSQLSKLKEVHCRFVFGAGKGARLVFPKFVDHRVDNIFDAAPIHTRNVDGALLKNDVEERPVDMLAMVR